MSEEERDDDVPSLADFMHGLAATAMLTEALETALAEFTESRWPHLLKHGTVTDEDGSNPFTGGATAMFLSVVEMKALDALFTEMRRQETLPGAICPFASLLRHIMQRTSEAQQQAALYDHAQTMRPDEPDLN